MYTSGISNSDPQNFTLGRAGPNPVIHPSRIHKITKFVLAALVIIGTIAAAVLIAGAVGFAATSLTPAILMVAMVVAAVAIGILVLYGLYRLGCRFFAEHQINKATTTLIQKFSDSAEKGFLLENEIDTLHLELVNLQKVSPFNNSSKIVKQIEKLEVLKKLAESQRLLDEAMRANPQQFGLLKIQAGAKACAAHQLIAQSENGGELREVLGAAEKATRERVLDQASIREELLEEIQTMIQDHIGLKKLQFLQLVLPKIDALKKTCNSLLSPLRDECLEQHGAILQRVHTIAKALPS
jgi:hypothetical protein